MLIANVKIFTIPINATLNVIPQNFFLLMHLMNVKLVKKLIIIMQPIKLAQLAVIRVNKMPPELIVLVQRIHISL